MVRKRFGQHFLESQWADKVAAAIDPGPTDSFIEIGPGPGILTVRLAARAAHVTAVEIDRDLACELQHALPPNVTLLTADFLDLTPAQLSSGQSPGSALRVAGNLPYNISSPILFRLLDLQPLLLLRDATIMVQREVAERIVAEPGCAEYGVMSILVQHKAAATRVLKLPPGAFRPPPTVNSALVRLTFHEPQPRVADPALFERLVRSMFTKRRKMLLNALADFAATTTTAAEAALARAGIDSRRRPETLQLVEIARLADVFASS